jgi:ABC-type lipoprotein export system ATPase subunit
MTWSPEAGPSGTRHTKRRAYADLWRAAPRSYGTGQGGQVTAADNVTFTVEAGAFVALTGASGSGKSTLLHMIGAIERPDSGVIICNGTEVTALRGAAQADYRRTVGFVFQRYNLLPALTALDNVIAPVLPYRTAWDKRDRGRRLLAAVGLAGRERWASWADQPDRPDKRTDQHLRAGTRFDLPEQDKARSL